MEDTTDYLSLKSEWVTRRPYDTGLRGLWNRIMTWWWNRK